MADSPIPGAPSQEQVEVLGILVNSQHIDQEDADALTALLTAYNRSLEEAARLREALEPFAASAARAEGRGDLAVPDQMGFSDPDLCFPILTDISVADLNRARAAWMSCPPASSNRVQPGEEG